MRIETVDFYYLSMPEVKNISDGSQDCLLVRVQADDYEGWGECEASPLVSIASFVCPISHGACRPIKDSIIGQELNSTEDIERIHRLVRRNSLNLLQTDHTLSGIDIALWDLIGKKFGEPIYKLLGYEKAFPKTAYASQLFGDTPDETYKKAKTVYEAGFKAAKFGWGPFGLGSVEDDERQILAARQGLGENTLLLVDAGTVWQSDVDRASARLKILEKYNVEWLEEPFTAEAINAYRKLAERCVSVKIAGGEGAHNPDMAQHLIDFGNIGYIQIDAGCIGGITAAVKVAKYVQNKNVKYVNHTFTTPLILSASIQPYAGMASHNLCEYPFEPSSLAKEIAYEKLVPDSHGQINLPERPGLGITPNLDTIRKYLVDVKIKVNKEVIFTNPVL